MKLPSAIATRTTLAGASLLLAATLTAAWALISSEKYSAEATLKPLGSKGNLGALSSVASQLGIGLGVSGEEQSLEYFIALMTSREVMGTVLERSYPMDSVRTALLADVVGAEGETPTDRRLDGIERLRRRVSSSPDLRAGLIRVRVELPTGALAEAVATDIIQLANQLSSNVKRAQANDEKLFLMERVKEAGDRLEALEDDLARFLIKNRAVEGSAELRLEASRRERQVELAVQLVGALQRDLEAARLEEARTTSSLAMVESPNQSARPVKRPIVLAFVALFIATFVAGLVLERLRAASM